MRVRLGGIVLGAFLSVALACGALDVRLQFGGGFSTRGLVWRPRDLSALLYRWEKDQRKIADKARQSEAWLKPPPVRQFPSWHQCQQLAWDHRVDALLIRMNLAAVKAARKMMEGGLDHSRERRLAEDLPWGFSPRDWAERILRDIRFSCGSKSSALRYLRIAEGGLRELFMEYRQRIEGEVVRLYDAWRRATKKGPGDENPAAWELWHAMGYPKRLR